MKKNKHEFQSIFSKCMSINYILQIVVKQYMPNRYLIQNRQFVLLQSTTRPQIPASSPYSMYNFTIEPLIETVYWDSFIPVYDNIYLHYIIFKRFLSSLKREREVLLKIPSINLFTEYFCNIITIEC